MERSASLITATKRKLCKCSIRRVSQVDHNWIDNVNALFEDMSIEMQRDLEILKNEEKSVEKYLHELCKQLEVRIHWFEVQRSRNSIISRRVSLLRPYVQTYAAF